jgi:hypothetical protein
MGLFFNGGGSGPGAGPDCESGDTCDSCDEAFLLWCSPPWPTNGTTGGGSGSNAPNNPTQPTACQQTVLNAVNNQFGTNLSASNISSTSDPNPQPGGQVNVNFSINGGLTATQFNAIQTGRYAPSGFWGVLTGYGPSLHVVAAPSGLDLNTLTFSNSNVGGVYSASFTAHIDSAWADNPIGPLLHWFIDILGAKSRNPCP